MSRTQFHADFLRSSAIRDDVPGQAVCRRGPYLQIGIVTAVTMTKLRYGEKGEGLSSSSFASPRHIFRVSNPLASMSLV